MSEPSDEELVRQYRDGRSAAAFRLLYFRHRVSTFNFILHLVREKAASEDLHQEIWVGLTESVKKWQPSGAFRGWLFQVVRNRCTDHFRSQKRSLIDFDDDDDGSAIELPAANAPATGDHKLRDALLGCIGTLNTNQRQVFYLRAIEDMTFSEITDVMASAPGLSNRRMQLAVTHLKTCLESKGIRAEA